VADFVLVVVNYLVFQTVGSDHENNLKTFPVRTVFGLRNTALDHDASHPKPLSHKVSDKVVTFIQKYQIVCFEKEKNYIVITKKT